MKGSDLFRQLKQFGDLDIQEEVVIGWIDMAQKKASLDLPVVRSITLSNVQAGQIVPVSTGVFSLISVIPSDYPLSNILLTSNSMVFSEAADQLTIKFSSVSPDFTQLNDELTIHPSLHAPLIYFLISMYYDMEGEGDSEESGLAERFYQRWVYYRNLAIGALQGTQNELPQREPVPTKDVMPRSSGRRRRDLYYE